MKRKILIFSLVGLVVLLLVGGMVYMAGGFNAKVDNQKIQEISTNNNQETDLTDHEEATDYIWSDSEVKKISLNAEKITTNANGVVVDGQVATIKSAGTYQLQGDLTDGQIVVDTDEEEVVRIILAGAKISCSDGSAILVKKAKKVIVVAADGSENVLSDGSTYATSGNSDEDQPNAALYSTADLTLYGLGEGKLVINGNYNDGIASKDGLVLRNISVEVEAVDDGIRGKDYVAVKNADISVEVGGDGVKSDNEENDQKGNIIFYSGVAKVVAGKDGLSAANLLEIKDGQIEVTTGGGSKNSLKSNDESMKGVKAGKTVRIYGGNIIIDSADDAIHSNGVLVIDQGEIVISSGDDGIHADASIEINGGNIDIQKSYEGIESAVITFNDGTTKIVASDDGVNVAGGNDGSALGRMGQGSFDQAEEGCYLYINGGYIYANAGGDGLDSNGSVVMTGGTAVVDGPINNGNGPLDYNGTFDISGGYLLAVGSSGMAQAPSESSTQNSILVNFDTMQAAGTLINIQDSNGNNLLTYSPAKQYQSIVFSGSKIAQGETYSLYLGGSSTGEKNNGLYQNGIYTPGELNQTFSVDGIVTKVGQVMAGGPGGGMGFGRGMNDATTTQNNTFSVDSNNSSSEINDGQSMGNMPPPQGAGNMPSEGIPPDGIGPQDARMSNGIPSSAVGNEKN
ncbi:MAG: carbohydrate-binding domain-containing protein [Patescibacteria group bacterium]